MGKLLKGLLFLFFGFMALSIIMAINSEPEPLPNDDTETAQIASSNESAPTSDTLEVGAPTSSSNWEYDESVDEMRGETSYFATNRSLNSIELEFPYGDGIYLNILLRKDAENNKDILFIANKGQLFCTYRDCHINVKFDDGSIQKLEASEAAAGSSEVLFLANDISGFANKLKSAEQVIVEVNFFNHGNEQFKFDVSGLDWSHF